jgi:hypothetical protein
MSDKKGEELEDLKQEFKDDGFYCKIQDTIIEEKDEDDSLNWKVIK